MSGIKMKMVKLEVVVSEKEIKKYGGLQNYKDLLYNILDRYGNGEYFDEDIIKEQSEAK